LIGYQLRYIRVGDYGTMKIYYNRVSRVDFKHLWW